MAMAVVGSDHFLILELDSGPSRRNRHHGGSGRGPGKRELEAKGSAIAAGSLPRGPGMSHRAGVSTPRRALFGESRKSRGQHAECPMWGFPPGDKLLILARPDQR